MKLYSKDAPSASIEAMKRSGRIAHAFLLIGERGVGKKTFADHIAMTLLCENGNACGKCRHCRRILAGTHPDVIKPEKTGKKQIFSRDTVREICSDAFVAPNDCDAKVYIFSDCESLEESTQNLMLKLIEEPPDTVYFIFTAVSRGALLPTVLSRVITIGISECTEEDCRAALEDCGKYSAEQVSDAVRRFHGNIGNCMDYLAGGETAENVGLCCGIIAAVANGSEYDLLKALYEIGEDRGRIRRVFELIDKVVRDACVLRLGTAPLIGCDPDGAEKLSRTISRRRAQTLHAEINKTIVRCAGTINVPPEMAAFAAAVISS